MADELPSAAKVLFLNRCAEALCATHHLAEAPMINLSVACTSTGAFKSAAQAASRAVTLSEKMWGNMLSLSLLQLASCEASRACEELAARGAVRPRTERHVK